MIDVGFRISKSEPLSQRSSQETTLFLVFLMSRKPTKGGRMHDIVMGIGTLNCEDSHVPPNVARPIPCALLCRLLMYY